MCQSWWSSPLRSVFDTAQSELVNETLIRNRKLSWVSPTAPLMDHSWCGWNQGYNTSSLVEHSVTIQSYTPQTQWNHIGHCHIIWPVSILLSRLHFSPHLHLWALSTTIIVFNLFYRSIKSLLLGIEWLFKYWYQFKQIWVIFTDRLQVDSHRSETQLYAGEQF